MKFMVNGALTVGTLDGANIEMAEAVGRENIFTFGLTADRVMDLQRRGYRPADYIASCPALKEILKMVRSDFFSPNEPGIFNPLVSTIADTDYFMVCADFDPYLKAQEAISREYQSPDEWARKAVLNVAKSGRFSSDRTIVEYARDIWNVPYSKMK
jgi:starch phosphorylase